MGEIKRIIAYAPMFPDGQKVSAAILEYDRDIQNMSLSPEQFAVEGRQILRVRANDLPKIPDEGKDGRYVVIELSPREPGADVIVEPPRGNGPPPPKYRRVPSVSVSQRLPITAADGGVIAAEDGFASSSEAIEPVIDRFQSLSYDGLKYYLYVPEGYDPKEQYPLVLFMTDLGANGSDDRMALSQGIGGTVWATKAEQRKHKAFVLVPQFPFMQVMHDDNRTFDPIFLKIKPLLDRIVEQYSIDKSRIYVTGQSQGCMAACELNAEYPDLFAASLLVAGQWDPERMKENCAKQNYWIMISELDERAHPVMDAMTDALAENGAVVKKYYWDAKASDEQKRAYVQDALKDDANIRYTYFIGDSVLPPEDNGPNRLHHVHAATWPVAYDIEGVRDWLFSCKR